MTVTKNEYYTEQAKLRQGSRGTGPVVKYATVIEMTLQGEPIIQFMGDSLPSQKIYVRLKHYIPEVGDRVILINNIIQGGWQPSNT